MKDEFRIRSRSARRSVWAAVAVAVWAISVMAAYTWGHERGLVVAIYVTGPDGTEARAEVSRIALPPGTVPGPVPPTLNLDAKTRGKR